MAFVPSRAIFIVLLFLPMNPVYSSDLDQELRTTLAVIQLVLKEQSSSLAHHSQALSQLLQRQERSEVTDMAEIIQTSLRYMIDELAATLTDRLSQQSQTTNQAIQEMTETLSTLVNKQSQTMIQAMQQFCQTLPQVTTPPSVTLPQVTTPSTSSIPPEAERVSDGVFLIVKKGKTWMEAKDSCQEMGGFLASPPSDFDAFKTFVENAVGGKEVWLGGREEGSRGYKYLDGTPVHPEHWASGQPNHPNTCIFMNAYSNPPLWDFYCPTSEYYICRFY